MKSISQLTHALGRGVKPFPRRFLKDLDLGQEIIDYYKKFYNKTLNKEQVKEILSGGPEASDQKK